MKCAYLEDTNSLYLAIYSSGVNGNGSSLTILSNSLVTAKDNICPLCLSIRASPTPVSLVVRPLSASICKDPLVATLSSVSPAIAFFATSKSYSSLRFCSDISTSTRVCPSIPKAPASCVAEDT